VIEKLKDVDDEEVTRKVSWNHPVSDFKEMINYRKEDLVLSACK